jgi:hypothetical protein
VHVLSLDSNDANRLKIHNENSLPNDELKFMYPRHVIVNARKVAELYTYYSILNRLLRKTIAQRGGNPTDISLHARNLLARMRPRALDSVLLISFGKKSSKF